MITTEKFAKQNLENDSQSKIQNPKSKIQNGISLPKQAPLVESEANPDNSLEKVIELVNEWMSDESDYDEETYPQIEAALNQNQLSL